MSPRAESAERTASGTRLSYKFQRLREQIRQTILSGELNGQLPGERELARRFGANAKTINKALADLSVDGLVRRFIGRGTFVTLGSDEGISKTAQRRVHWIGELGGEESAAFNERGHTIVRRDVLPNGSPELNPAATFFRDEAPLDALVIAVSRPLSRPGRGKPGVEFQSQLLRRQVPTLLLGATSEHVRQSAVVPDYSQAGFCLAEHLFGLGMTEIVAVHGDESAREIRSALDGYRTSCQRHDRAGRQLPVEAVGVGSAWCSGTGLLCIGGAALERVIQAGARSPIAAVMEPGDSAGERAGVTTVEFEVGRMLEWSARLIDEIRAGSTPIQVLVPGLMVLRGGGGAASERLSDAILS